MTYLNSLTFQASDAHGQARGERLNNYGGSDFVTRAAQYVRMSTDLQKYSIENQLDVIGRYAEQRGISIVQTYTDDGKTGLILGGRNALRRLIEDVQNGRADFSSILVYVSAAGADFRTLTRARTMSTSARGPVSPFIIVLSSSKTTEA